MKDVGSGRYILSNFRTEIFHIVNRHDNQCYIKILIFVFKGQLLGIKEHKTDLVNYLRIYKLQTDLLTTNLLTYLLTYLLIYSFTHSMEQSPS
jgi:hypothetical protein